MAGSSQGVLRVVSRWNQAPHSETIRNQILRKRTFCTTTLPHKKMCRYYEYGRSCLPCTALPYSHTAAWPRGSRHSMYCAISSEWGLFGRNTRSAFRRTPSLNKSHFFSLVDAPGIVVFMVLLFPNSHVCTKSPLVHKTQMAIVFSEQCLRLAI